MSYLYVFLQSNLLELIYFLVVFRRLRILGQVTVMNSITHPIVFFVIMALPFSYLTNILTAEAFAIGAESLLLRRILPSGVGWALCHSTLANLLSWQLGPILTWLFFQSP